MLGASGFVGTAIVRRLMADGVSHIALTRKAVDLLAEGAAGRLKAILQPTDSLVMTSATVPCRTPTMLVENLRMAEAVCDALVASSVAHVVYISSDAVYADNANLITEESCCAPSTLHGAMHLARELMLQSVIRAPLAILRPSLLYGAGDPHNGYGPNRFGRLAASGDPIRLFGEGEELRDHVFVDDVATIVVLTLAYRSRGVLNVATGVSTSFRQVAEMVAAQYAAPVEITSTPRTTPIVHRHFDITACLKAFPTFRYTSLDKGLRRVGQETVGHA